MNATNSQNRVFVETYMLLRLALSFVSIVAGVFFCGCSGVGGYTSQSLFRSDVQSIYVEMFDNRSFWRGVEYDLTDALAKRIEAQTPYKIVSDRNLADTVISGQIESVNQSVLSLERQTGKALEKNVELRAVVNWKNLRTGELLIQNRSVLAAAGYSEFQQQDFKYASQLAANNLAQHIVELMETQW
jgi:hypothetical protein